MPQNQQLTPTGPALTDGQIDALFAAAGIVVEPSDADELRILARYLLLQASRIAGPLPFAVEPAPVFSPISAARRQ